MSVPTRAHVTRHPPQLHDALGGMRFAVSVAADPGASPRRRGLHRRASDKEAGREARLVLVRLTIHVLLQGQFLFGPRTENSAGLGGIYRALV